MDKNIFNWRNISRLPYDQHGVYSIWSKSICIYVGQAKKQSIKDRLLQHYSGSHNDYLALWIKSTHGLFFSVEFIKNPAAIDAKERINIKLFAPLTNIKLVT
jgi:predicted GIY-YIG superfamily endonuclease